MRFVYLFFIFFTLTLLSSCSTQVGHVVDYQHSFPFSNVKSFSLFPRNSNFYNNQSLPDATRNRFELAIESALEAQGFNYVPIDRANVIVSYFSVSENRGQLLKYNRAVRFCLSCSHQPNRQMLADNYPEGTVIVDILDTKSERSVWRGLFKLSSYAQKSDARKEQAIRAGITSMLSQFPPAALPQ